MIYPMEIEALAMCSSMGVGAEWNAALMRCGYNNFRQTDFINQESGAALLGAGIAEAEDYYGVARYSRIAALVIEELQSKRQIDLENIVIIFCLPSIDNLPSNNFHEAFNDQIVKYLDIQTISKDSLFYYTDHCSVVDALISTRKLISTGIEEVMLIGIDTLLNARRITKYDYEYGLSRLLSENNSDGFIPGEAGAGLILRQHNPNSTATCITGLGYGSESGSFGSDEALTGKGMTSAVLEVLNDTGLKASDFDFRISNASGELYSFKEVALTSIQILQEKRETWPLWHPAEYVGEVGSAIGLIMLLMAHFAFEKSYAPGTRALCLLSDDDDKRAAIAIERWEIQT